MRKIKIVFDMPRKQFFVDDSDFQQAFPETMPTIQTFVADLNKIELRKKVGMASWVWIIFILYLISFFLIFVRWYLVFVPVTLFIAFMVIMAYFGRQWLRFRQEIDRVCQSFSSPFANYYVVENKFNKTRRRVRGHNMMIVLKPIILGVIPRAGMPNPLSYNPEPIPIYAFNPYPNGENLPAPDVVMTPQQANNYNQGLYTMPQQYSYPNNQGYAPPPHLLQQGQNGYTPNVYTVPRIQPNESYDLENQSLSKQGIQKQE
jgi:hypothetical protein